jgi:glycine betaine/proline transport system substrate-binding protein
MRRALISVVCSFIALALSGAVANAKLPGEGKTVTPCYDQLIEAVFQTEILNIGLEKLGYKVNDYANLTIPMMYVANAQHDVDYCADAYTPLQNFYYDKAGGSEKITKVGALIKGAGQGYLIDKKTADKYHITNVEQLKDPNIAKLFDTDGDGKADLAGCPPGWGCERAIEHQLDAYGLRNTVTHHQGEFLVMAADTISRFKAGESVLYYTYTPLWVSQVLVPGRDVVYLQVPFTSLPEGAKGEGQERTTVNGFNYGFEFNTIGVVANNKFLTENPAAKRFFELATIPIDDVNAQNLKVYNGQKTMADVHRHAEEWIKAHQQEFDTWIEESMKAAQ